MSNKQDMNFYKLPIIEQFVLQTSMSFQIQYTRFLAFFHLNISRFLYRLYRSLKIVIIKNGSRGF